MVRHEVSGQDPCVAGTRNDGMVRHDVVPGQDPCEAGTKGEDMVRHDVMPGQDPCEAGTRSNRPVRAAPCGRGSGLAAGGGVLVSARNWTRTAIPCLARPVLTVDSIPGEASY